MTRLRMLDEAGQKWGPHELGLAFDVVDISSDYEWILAANGSFSFDEIEQAAPIGSDGPLEAVSGTHDERAWAVGASGMVVRLEVDYVTCPHYP